MLKTYIKGKLLLILLSVLAGVSACDPGVEYSRILVNGSSYDLYLISRLDSTFDTSKILIGSSLEFLQDSHFGKIRAHEDCIERYEYLDSFYLVVQGNDSIHVDVDVLGNKDWHYTQDKKYISGGGTCHCTLIVTNEKVN